MKLKAMPWYKFWNPHSGFPGGITFMIFCFIAFALFGLTAVGIIFAVEVLVLVWWFGNR